MNRALLVATTAVSLAACGSASNGAPGASSAAVHAAAETITATEMRDRIGFLASDELRGRDTPSPGLETAARWIADELQSFGAEPAGDDGGWMQRWPYPAVGLDTDATELTVTAGATHTFTYGVDFFAQGGQRTVEDGGAGMLFVGRELTEDAAVQDRVVILRLPGLPEQGRSGWRLDRQARATASRTLERAGEQGARGVVFVLDPSIPAEDIERLAESSRTPGRTYGAADAAAGPPAFFVRHAAGLRLFRMAGLDGATLLERRELDAPVPLAGLTAIASAPRRIVDDARPPNVVGIVRGSDPELRDTYVVVTAHMDHVGVGRPDATGDSIYNGADDDASGTSVLVEVAQAVAGMDPRPRRSVLFVAVSGEEKGLLGSRWFSDNPTVPLEAMVANVNIDMVGRNAPDSIVVIGQEYSSLGPLVRRIAADNPELGLTVSEDLWPQQRFFFRSDHFNFARKEIPALFFFAGTHEDYHRPGDEVEEVDIDKTTRVGRLVFYLTHAVADAETLPEWDPQGLEEVRELTSQ